MTGSGRALFGPLFRHDARILANELRWALAGWFDRLTACAALAIALALLGSWKAQAPAVAGWWIAGAAALIGFGVERLLRSRVAFHSGDGALTAAALSRGARRAYLALWHAGVLACLVLVSALVRFDLPGWEALFYLAGAAVARLLPRGTPATIGAATARKLALALRQHSAGLVLGGGTALVIVAAAALRPASQPILPGIVYLAGLLSLIGIDDAVVRFMTLSGYGTGRVIARHVRAPLLFLGVALPAWLLAYGPMLAGVAAGIAMLVLLYTVLRICALRLLPRRKAEVLVGLCAGLVAGTGFVVPVLAPLVATIIAWKLYRRAGAATWTIA